jgi:protein involved in polysaccharide export with SLBB domain
VKKPGPYHIPPGTSAFEAIAMAGGPEDTALLKDCAIVRIQPRPERIPVNLEKLMKAGDMSQNPALSDRDIVFVPVRAADKNAAAKKSAFEVISGMGESLLRYVWMFRYF